MPTIDSTSPDGTLIAAVLAGEGEAFAHVVERYQRPLLRVAMSRLGQQALAEDVVQETFFCAVKWLHTYDSRYSFRTWLWTILLNQCSRQGRREARQAAAVVSAESQPELAIDPACPERSPLDQMLASEDGRLVHALLTRLPVAQADALRLRFFGGLTFPEIAAAMKCSESGAKNRVKLGLLQLSKWLTGSCGGCIAATTGRDESVTATTGRGYASGEPASGE